MQIKTSRLNTYFQALPPLTLHLFIFAIVNIVLINFVLPWLFSISWEDTVLYHTQQFFKMKENSDSWFPMSQALDYIQSHPRKPLYEEIFFDKKIKFQYPTTSLLVAYFLNLVPGGVHCTNTVCYLYGGDKLFSWLFLMIMSYFTIQIFDLSLKRNFGETYSGKIDWLVRAVVLFCLILTFYPAVKAYSLGQIQTWLNALFTVLFWYWMKGQQSFSGIILGFMCLIKPQYLVILLWGILRKKWNFFVAAIITFLVGLMISILLFGIENHIGYLSVLSFISKHGESFHSNQSVNGLLNRLLFNGNNLKWDENSFPAFNFWVYFGTVVSSVAFISLALFWSNKVNERGSIVDFSIVALTCTMASPVAWEHHYGILLPIYAFLLPCLLKQRIFGKITIPYLFISYLLSSNYFAITNRFADTQFNVIQSYLFFGALMVLGCLYSLKNIHIYTNQNAIDV